MLPESLPAPRPRLRWFWFELGRLGRTPKARQNSRATLCRTFAGSWGLSGRRRLGLGDLLGHLRHYRKFRGVRSAVRGDRQDLANLRRPAQIMKPGDQRREPG